jgi:hypothetical protein
VQVVRETEKQEARAVRSGGGGSTSTGTIPRSSPPKEQTAGSIGGILKGVARGLGGFVTGGPAGAVAGIAQSFASPERCPDGFERRGSNCVQVLPTPGFGGALERALPFGSTGMSPSGGMAVQGAFGLPAMSPDVVSTIRRRCAPGLVLGRDNLCYPRAILGRRSGFRKWRQPPRPAVSGSDLKAVRRANRLEDRVKRLNKDLGLRVPSKPKR